MDKHFEQYAVSHLHHVMLWTICFAAGLVALVIKAWCWHTHQGHLIHRKAHRLTIWSMCIMLRKFMNNARTTVSWRFHVWSNAIRQWIRATCVVQRRLIRIISVTAKWWWNSSEHSPNPVWDSVIMDCMKFVNVQQYFSEKATSLQRSHWMQIYPTLVQICSATDERLVIKKMKTTPT